VETVTVRFLEESMVSSRPDFSDIVLTPGGVPDPSPAIAGSRAGAPGVLKLKFADDEAVAIAAPRRLEDFGRGRLGVLVDLEAWGLFNAVQAEPVPGLGTVIFTGVIRDRLGHFVDLIQEKIKIVSGREPDGDPCSEPASAPWAFHRSIAPSLHRGVGRFSCSSCVTKGGDRGGVEKGLREARQTVDSRTCVGSCPCAPSRPLP